MKTVKSLFERITSLFGNKRDYFVHPTAIIDVKKGGKIHFGKGAEVWEHAIIRAHGNAVVYIGERAQIGPGSVVFGGPKEVHIGNNVMLAPHCVISGGSHDYRQIEKPMRFAPDLTPKKPLIIEDNAWLGANVTVLYGVTIGREAVIGAGSVVKDDVPPYEIMMGVPAVSIGNRLERAKQYGNKQ